MQTVSRSNFTTVKTEGAILPADLLQRVANGDLDGMAPEAYHLAPSERPNEAINRAWNRCLGVWQSFNEQRQTLPASDSGVSLTRNRWLLILFQELGYGRLPYQGRLYAGNGELGVGNREKTSTPHSPLPTPYPISHLWEQTPIHLVSFRQELDRRDPTIRRSPHSLMQEFLNRSDDHLWGFVSNGLTLRLLRDNASLTRAAYVEFDLEMMMTGERYADFSLLWLVCHQSRVEILGSGELGIGNREEEPPTPHSLRPIPSDCWLESWSQEAAEQGTRALDALRDGVQEAIEALGRGFLAHPANGDLRDQLNHGGLSTQAYYRQLLRLVYRLIFLFVAEDRDLLLVPEAGSREWGIGNRDEEASTPRAPLPSPQEIKDRYMQYYSLSRLRRLAEARRGGPHPDLYRALRRLFLLLREGYPPLGLPALGSFLFSDRSTPALDEADLANHDLLNAIRALAFSIEGQVRRPVDYKNLGAEELGSVYESLLELHPQLNIAAATFDLAAAAGSERKTTGSYYTPASLINSLLDSALEPVIEARLQEARELAKEGNREWGIGNREKEDPTRSSEEINEQSTDSIVPGPESVAGRDETGGELLQSDKGLSSGGDLRNDVPDSPGGSLDSGQHRRGERPGEPGRVHPVSTHRPGVAQGVGDASTSVGTGGVGESGSHQSASDPMRNRGQDAESADSFASEKESREVGNREWGTKTPTPYSLLPTPHSPEEAALLNIKVVDPACGSGHFLIAAANRLAVHLARVRTGDDEPGPAARREALRDVVRHCIHGVDINEMAVELCKVALWMETLDPGKPLGFLDRNIRCGNSLIGATPALLKDGIPDEAFKPITGDDKAYCSEWRKRNKQERAGQTAMTLDAQPWERLGDLAAAMAALDQLGGDTLAGVQAQERRYADLVRSTPYLYSQFWADTWCAAFVWPKKPDYDGGYAYPITEAVFRKIERNPHDVAIWMREEIERLHDRYQFFHWHLAFPHVFGGVGNREIGNRVKETPTPYSLFPTPQDGFDVVLGNPPWERVRLHEKEWFASRRPEISNASNATQRHKKIASLKSNDPALYKAFQEARRQIEGMSHFVRSSGCYPLCGLGQVNTYAIFAEKNRLLLSRHGNGGFIIQSDIATSDTYKDFFADLLNTKQLISFYDFVNTEGIFPAVHRTHPHFCLFTIAGSAIAESTDFAFWNTNISHLKEAERHFTLSAADLALLNPNTRNCPIFRSQRDAKLTKGIYHSIPVLVNEDKPRTNSWEISFLRMFDMAGDSDLFRTKEQLEVANWRLEGNIYYKQDKAYLPLYEPKLVHQFDHRWATFEGVEPRDVTLAEKKTPEFSVMPRYWIPKMEVDKIAENNLIHPWLIGWRGVSNTTNERTIISAALPQIGVGHNFQLIASDSNPIYLLSNMNSYVLDYVARQKIGTSFVPYFVVKQLPILSLDTYLNIYPWSSNQFFGIWLNLRILELTFTAWDLRPFANDCGYLGPPFRWDEERRFLLRCELDAAYFHLYSIERDDVDYIMETFPIVKRKDEAAHGEYRTKRVILEIYDEMAEAMRTGQPYQTHLDPPPADSRVAHPWDAAYGPAPEQVWVEEKGIGSREWGIGETSAPYTPNSEPQTPNPELQTPNPEPRTPNPEPFALQSSPSEPKKPKRPKVAQGTQETLLEVMPAPGGPRSVRLKRAMALGNDLSPVATRELVAFLADGDSNIRWLAASSLVQRAGGDDEAGTDTVAAIATFLDKAEPERVEQARSEALRVLGLIAETAGVESVRAAAREVIERG